MEVIQMTNRAGWGYIEGKVVRLAANTVMGLLWGLFMPTPDGLKMEIHSPDGDLGLPVGARQALEDALRSGNKKKFIQKFTFYRDILRLDPEKSAYTLALCLEAMRKGSSRTVQDACLNLLGASFFMN